MNDERNAKDLLNDFDLMLSGYIASVNEGTVASEEESRLLITYTLLKSKVLAELK